jgi:hypothetical protein
MVAVGPVVVDMDGTVVADMDGAVVLDRTVYGTVVLDRTVDGTVVVDRVGSTSPDGATTPDRAAEVVGAAAGMEVAPHATASNRLPDQATDRTADPIRDQLPERVVSHAPPTRTSAPDT